MALFAKAASVYFLHGGDGMNEGLDVYLSLSPGGRERRLQRAGIHAEFVSAGGSRSKGNRRMSGAAGEERVRQDRAKESHREDIFRQRYRTAVFNLQPLGTALLGTGMDRMSFQSIWGQPTLSSRGVPSPGTEEDTPAVTVTGERGRLFKRLGSLAVKALYGLGLDSGEVLITAGGEGHYTVTGISPLVSAKGRALPEPYRQADEALRLALAGEGPNRPDLLMGMDPEFILLREDTGRVVPASRHLPLGGAAGCDAGPPGTRGVFPVAELRPGPRAAPRALMAQLRSAAMLADRLIPGPGIGWRAGGMPLRGWALGGHLHFSGVVLTAPLLRALDNYLALPVALLEDERASGRRPRYGTLGDFRLQPHGGFEYRTLPSFLVSPDIARGVIALAHLIVSRYEALPLRPLDREPVHAAYYGGGRKTLRAAAAPLIRQLRTLPEYAGLRGDAEPLLRMVEEGRRWEESRNIRELWRLEFDRVKDLDRSAESIFSPSR
ncbi:hypothetical protein KIH86_16595 [Paenibacillus sp. HN-1]|uniref:putative amidoligase domain-containing protein n=1 Tax=Paenibacillus TaxID=44249 RepID=UPI001CA7F72F|nr:MULTISPECIES: hypothetical protein [Paenibacillus]MBY9082016.1 hypothetical protein [Paenibacillus sp. CGMCC 1.18879]MBY9085826.1 hypothetical protein [Paenibacillus sinensis]